MRLDVKNRKIREKLALLEVERRERLAKRKVKQARDREQKRILAAGDTPTWERRDSYPNENAKKMAIERLLRFVSSS